MSFHVEFYKSILDSLFNGIYFADRDRRIIYWNRGAEVLTGYKASEVCGKPCRSNVLMHVDLNGTRLCENTCPVKKSIQEGRPIETEFFFHHKDGYLVPGYARINPIEDLSGRVIGAVHIFSDNSEAVAVRQKIEELERTALCDPITDLGNRRHAEMILHSRLSEMERYSLPFGLLFIDIDHFKRINDSYGHDTGDRVLRMVAKTLVNSIRASDVVARWGGEEFLAIMTNVNEEQLYSTANKLRALVEQSRFAISSETLSVTISVGATATRRDDTIDTLVQRADRLMYQSKASGRNRVTFE